MASARPFKIQQHWPLPSHPRPIVIIGAGGIVRDAHLPAYRLAGFTVHSMCDRTLEKARRLGAEYGVASVTDDLGQLIAAAPLDAVFDIALPAAAFVETLERLPDNATVLIQKPMGDDLEMAKTIRATCHRKNLTAAVNFQLRFCPYVMAARSLIDQDAIGQLHSIEVRVNCYMPWHMWDFLHGAPRVEIQYHSIHYIDMIRAFLGEPTGVHCRTLKHPKMMQLVSVRTICSLDYGDDRMVAIETSHAHEFGRRHQESYVKWEGTHGAILAKMGLLLNYPHGEPDALEYCLLKEGQEPAWQSIELEGSWIPEAFIGPMANLQRFSAGEDDRLLTNVDDVVKTMAVVEACYDSSEHGATPIPAC